VLSRLFTVTEKVSVAAFVNAGHVPDVWWANLALRLRERGLFDRLLKQIHRDTHAQMTSHSMRARADSPAGPKHVGPHNEQELLAEARRIALEAGAEVAEFEKLDDSALKEKAEQIIRWHEALVESFAFAQPARPGYDPAVLEYREWMSSRATIFMQEWRRILDSMPDRGAERLLVLAERVNRIMTAVQFLSENTAASAAARWARLDSVKKWAIDQRRLNSGGSRAAAIRALVPEVRRLAKEVGEPLSGSEEAVIRTITKWFRDAGVK
jgi:hypothetical protein